MTNNLLLLETCKMSVLGLSENALAQFCKNYESKPKNKLAETVCQKSDFIDFCVKKDKAISMANHVYTHKVAEVKPVTNQKASGRCWIFALLNAMRVPFMKQLEIEEFEFSQSYIFFWDKVERAYYALHSYTECAKRKEPVDGRLVQYLLKTPADDGGQWDMLVNIVRKHGVVPKSVHPDHFCAENSRRLNMLLTNKLREFCKQIYTLVENGSTDEQIETERLKMMDQIYTLCRIGYGSPPDKFSWEYYNKEKKYCKIGPISPQDFYNEYVKPAFDMESKVCLVNDPRKTNPYHEMYTVEFLGNMIGGSPTLYNNQPIEVLKNSAIKSIKEGEPLWFGCDVAKFFHRKLGVNDNTMFDYGLLFGVEIEGLNKADRLVYQESMMTHAMVLTGVSIDDADIPSKWRVENSWGDDTGDKGYVFMSDEWFSEYVLELVVDKKYLSEEVLSVLQKTPKMLPAWDPMGSLA